MSNKEIKAKFRLWFEKNGETVMGKGGARLLEAISDTGTLQEAITRIISETKKTEKVSYRYAWGMLKNIETRLGEPVVQRSRGGSGKGGTTLTDAGAHILQRYQHLERFIRDALQDDSLWETIGFSTAGRNEFAGEITDVTMDLLTAKITIKLREVTQITAVITKDAVVDLGLNLGDPVKVIVKSSDVMIEKNNT